MPQRNRNRRVYGGPQGADAWVEIKFITVEELEALQDAFAEIEDAEELEAETAALESTEENAEIDELSLEEGIAQKQVSKANTLLSEYILEWNWVDVHGSELAQPLNNPDVFKKLIPPETQYLMETIATGGEDAQKKGKRLKNKSRR